MVRFQILSDVLTVLWQNKQVYSCQVVSGYRENSTRKRLEKDRQGPVLGRRPSLFGGCLWRDWNDLRTRASRKRKEASGRRGGLCIWGKSRWGWRGNRWRLALQGLAGLGFAPNVVERHKTTQEWTMFPALKTMCPCLQVLTYTYAHILKWGSKVLQDCNSVYAFEHGSQHALHGTVLR